MVDANGRYLFECEQSNDGGKTWVPLPGFGSDFVFQATCRLREHSEDSRVRDHYFRVVNTQIGKVMVTWHRGLSSRIGRDVTN